MSKPSASLGYMTPEQEIARLAKLVSAAKALLSLQVGLAVGASRVRNALSWLGATYEQKHPVFRDFIDNIPRDIPLGGARLLWNPAVMLETDGRLARVEAKFRTALLNECVRIIERTNLPGLPARDLRDIRFRPETDMLSLVRVDAKRWCRWILPRSLRF